MISPPLHFDGLVTEVVFLGAESSVMDTEIDSDRGSGGSSTTKGTSTDTSSRHSNVSTAPSSADMAQNNQDDGRGGTRNRDPPAGRQAQKAGSGGFFDRAGRTFSFGIQKKSAHSTPTDESVPDMPPLPTLQREDENGRTRAMTASTTSTATPPKMQRNSDMDLGGDFSSMFNRFGKRASGSTLRSDQKTPSPEIPANTWQGHTWHGRLSPSNSGGAPSPTLEEQPTTPRHQPSFEYRSSASPDGALEDEDAKFLADSVAATRYLTDDGHKRSKSRSSMGLLQDEGSSAAMSKPPATYASVHSNDANDANENMFAGTTAGFSRPVVRQRPAERAASPPRNSKVMTTAEFEKFQKDTERKHLEKAVYGGSASDDEDEEEDEINYEEEEDEEEKAKEQARQKRAKQAQMLAYRQRNMKTTGNLAELGGRESPAFGARPGPMQTSLSAPHLSTIGKTPSPGGSDDEDEEVPLGILQAHGFPHKNRSASRLSHFGSVSNLHAASHAQAQMAAQAGRPASAAGEHASVNMRRASALPAFARNLPQDPFVGAGVSRPAMRESLSFGSGIGTPPPQQPPGMHPGGLVGVIVNEERSKAMRRGSPNLDGQRFGPGMDPMASMNPGTMYPGGNVGVPRMPQGAAMSPADQAQMQMNQQMTQFMQMQMQFMQMMAQQNQGGGMPQMQMPMGMPGMPGMPQQPGQPGGLPASQSYADLSTAPQLGNPMMMQPRRMDMGSRPMSMFQPNNSTMFNGPGGFGGSQHGGPGAGYTPSIAPSERSNIGLPGRYRPVSQAGGGGLNVPHQSGHARGPSAPTISLVAPDDSRSKSTVRVTSQPAHKTSSDEDDDEEGWEAMQAKKEARKSRWRMKKVGEMI